jgi:hypothetical protein
VVATASADEAAADAIGQLADAVDNPTFVRTFAYPSGTAYGLLLDAYAPGWTRRITADDDLGRLLAAAARIQPSSDVEAAAQRYGGAELRRAEAAREAAQQVRVADLRRRFVDGPVLILPNAGGTFISMGITPVPPAGTVYPGVRVNAAWGTLEADLVLRSQDQTTMAVPAPADIGESTIRGHGWTLTLAPGWVIRPARRPGDVEVRPAP